MGGKTLAQECLTPTQIYVAAVRSVQNHYRVKQVIHGLAHITGGGIEENLDRILPPGVDAEIDPSSWELPPVFRFLQESGSVADSEMRRVFNMGIGMAMIVSDFYSSSIQSQLAESGIQAAPIGRITFGSGKVRYV